MKRRNPAGIKVTAKAMCNILDIRPFDDLYEDNIEWISDYAYEGVQIMLSEGTLYIDPDDEDAVLEERFKLESEIQDSFYKAYQNNFEAVVDNVVGEFYMVAQRTKSNDWLLKPVKGKTWLDVCSEIVQTINGVGYFWFDGPAHLKESGPYKSYKEAVAMHIGYIGDYWEVYGTGRKPSSMFERGMEVDTRNI